ncbi:MAG: DinB family protein [Thermoplasmata archaeon]
MNVSDFSQLFAYMAASRRQFLTKFRELGWDEVTENREATHHSMRNILIHMLDVEDSYLQEVVLGNDMTELDPESFKSFDETEVYNSEVTERTREFFATLSPEDLERKVSVPWWKGKAKFRVEPILLHAFLDEMAHLGELICLMWQIGVEPPFRSMVRSWTNTRPAPSE